MGHTYKVAGNVYENPELCAMAGVNITKTEIRDIS